MTKYESLNPDNELKEARAEDGESVGKEGSRFKMGFTPIVSFTRLHLP